MSQKPIKKIKIQNKATKYKKLLKSPKEAGDVLTKRINKKIIESSEIEQKLRNINKGK